MSYSTYWIKQTADVQVRPVVASDLLTTGTREQQRDWNSAQTLITQVWQQVFGTDEETIIAKPGDVFTQPDSPFSVPGSRQKPGDVNAKTASTTADRDSIHSTTEGVPKRQSTASLTSLAPSNSSPSAKQALERAHLLELDACKVCTIQNPNY